MPKRGCARSRPQICVRGTSGGWEQGAPAATCAKKRTRSPSGRPSILEEGAGVTRLSAPEGILLDLVDDRAAALASRRRNILRPVTGDLEGEAVPHGL